MSEAPALIYLEADDEITTVVRRLRAAEPGPVTIVAPGRSRATSSAVALRLLARAAEAEGRELTIVGDALTRSLAAEAGLTAYASVEDARRADPASAEAAEAAQAPRHAAIHVVRGPVSDETVAVPRPAVGAADTETRPVPAVRATPRAAAPATSPTRRRAGIAPIALLAALGIALVSAAVAAIAILPAATIRIVPRGEAIGPVAYEVTITDPERLSGTVEQTAVVAATGTYPIEAAATGAVVFFNFNFVAVEVPPETLVAAGEQAFATTEGVVVPAGTLTGAGTILAGEGVAAIVAAAPGPDGNVGVRAIDTVLSQATAGRLRGFPNNNQRLVENPDPTAGGLIDTGIEITPADVDTAVAALRVALAAAVADALAEADDAIVADAPDLPAAAITGLEELVGTRDTATAEIGGTLAYDRLWVERDEISGRAMDRFAEDVDGIPPGHELLPDSVTVTIGAARRDGDAIVVVATVNARTTPIVERADVLERTIGRSPAEAEAALEHLGAVRVELWPGWVTQVPDSDWRIDIQLSDSDSAQPLPSAS